MSWMKEIVDIRKTRDGEVKRLISRGCYSNDQIAEIIRICGWSCTTADVRRICEQLP